MDKRILSHELRSAQAFMEHVCSVITEEDSTFVPFPGMFTVAQQVAHAGSSIDWLRGGATNPEGFDMDFERHMRELMAVQSLTQAKQILADAVANADKWLDGVSEEELASPLPPGFVMGGEPKQKVIWGMVEHTAHHRGSLVVYARALGRVAPMPYEAQVPWTG